MTIDIRGLDNEATLAQIAKLAYGSGRTEKESGGMGNIGLLEGRAVKFNTHWSERGGAPSAEMRASCNALRTRLSEIATAMLSASPEATREERAKFDKALASVRKLLGMPGDDGRVVSTKLLDRKVVAKVINTIDKATGFDAWSELRAGGAARTLSSKGVDTSFGRVDYDVRLPGVVAGAVAAIAHPADGKPGASLNAEATKFLTDLVQRDVAARRASGLPVPTLDELDGGIRDFTSPYLLVTLQTFNLSSAVLSHAYRSVNSAEQSSASLAGSPREQRADRADVALGFMQGLGPRESYLAGFAMALVAEKMSEMRQLQPEGRLTGATVWRACFGESAPKETGDIGSSTFAKAFCRRLNRLTVELTAQFGADDIRGKGLNIDRLLNRDPRVASGLFNGASFTSTIRKGVGDPTFVPDVSRDYVSAPPLYPLQDAEVKTEDDRRKGLCADIVRNFPVVRTHNGAAEATTDFRPLDGQGLNAETIRPHVEAFVAQMDGVFGDSITSAQRSVMQMGLTQAGLATFTALLGVGGEHSQAQIDIRREGDGSLVMTYESLPDNPVEARYSFRIEPNGTNCRVGEFVSRERPQPAAE